MCFEYFIGFLLGAVITQTIIFVFIYLDTRVMKKHFNEKYKDFQK